MSFLGRLVAPQRKSAGDTLEIFRELFGSRLSKAGIAVNWDTAIRVSTVLACASVISRGIAQVPLKVFLQQGESKTPALDHPLYYLLHNQPNPWQTSFEYRETMGLHLALAGKHYSFINRVSGGRIEELISFEPQKVCVDRATDGTLTYNITMPNGAQQAFPQEAIWHVRGPSWNGWQGMDPVELAREAIGLAIAAEEQHARLFRNGVRPSGTYSVEGKLLPDQYKVLREFIVENTTGDNASMPLIVDRGAKWLPQAMSGVDSQHLETRRFQVEEICRSFGVMPIMVGFADKTATYASVEQMLIAHVVHCLSPWYIRLQQSIDAHLIGKRDVVRGYYAKFIAQGLLHGAMQDRAEYFAKALGAGGSPAWMTQDEVRGLEELNPMGGAAAKLPVPTNVGGGQPQPAANDDT
ncbi:phage portal protein [Azohydromonas lata]|uniref:phage portal protein n=1 Tax=Azohydromonas lata TaxID=45677 RepID=UPI0009FF589E|nr:phage portal protein [Azohydromonas lata]